MTSAGRRQAADGPAKGYHGKVLRVDLTTGRHEVEEVPEGVYRRYLGGGALATYFLLRDLPSGVDPLGRANTLVVMTSVINGTSLSGANRYSAAAKSPLSDGFGEAEAGGYWGPELKASGYDGVIVTGKASKPVYLWIHDGEVEVRDASPYWGKLASEVQEGLERELADRRVRVLQCGIAGERLVRYAAMVNQCRHFHGRAGLGAVMGSKNLKAIVVRGRIVPRPVEREAAREVLEWFREHFDPQGDPRHLNGTAQGIPSLQADGILPTRNFQDGNFEHFRAISGQVMSQTILVNRGTCFACAVACKREVSVPEYGVEAKHGGMEYETVAATGSLTGVGDLKRIARYSTLVNEYVLDSISTGMSIAWAQECYERGLILKEDTGGLDLSWGNADAVETLIHQIARREGFGDLLAEGTARAAQRIGRGTEQFVLTCKCQEFPMHEPRGKRSLALAYALSPTGADHMEAPHDPAFEGFDVHDTSPLGTLGLIEPVDRMDLGPRKVRAFFYAQQVWSAYNAIGMCDFVGVPIGVLALQKLVEYVNAVTGWQMSLHEFLKVGERANTMARLFNDREGFTAADDSLPPRMFEGLGNGPLEGERIDPDEFERAKRLYYEMAGWEAATGFPTAGKLAELELDWAVGR
ncbi:MAG: aldehyde ferredoxin oxidoreductase family protein [Chloroflexi bacterium]|nr:aldehyde ferredoxin oxidoreductase family protein [Chloroflexota bacterium]